MVVDEIFGSLFDPNHHVLASDIYETKDSFIIEVDVPGFQKENIDLQLDRHELLISAKRTSSRPEDCKSSHTEKGLGTFKRRFTLPNKTRLEDISASQDNGVLTVKVPKVKAPTPSKIVIT